MSSINALSPESSLFSIITNELSDELKELLSKDQTLINHFFDGYGITPLHLAIHKKHLVTVTILLEAGADVNIKYRNEIPINYVLRIYDDNIDVHRKIFLKLLAHGSDVEHLDYFGMTPLGRAALQNKTYFLQLLLAHNALDTALDRDKNTVFHWVIKSPHKLHKKIDLFKILLRYYTYMEKINTHILSVMEILVKRNCISIIREIIPYNVKFNYIDKHVQALFSNNWHNNGPTHGFLPVFFLYHLILRNPNSIDKMLQFYCYRKFLIYFEELKLMQRTLYPNSNGQTFYQILILDINNLAYAAIQYPNFYLNEPIDYIDIFPLFLGILLVKIRVIKRQYVRRMYFLKTYKPPSTKMILPNNILQIISSLIKYE